MGVSRRSTNRKDSLCRLQSTELKTSMRSDVCYLERQKSAETLLESKQTANTNK